MNCFGNVLVLCVGVVKAEPTCFAIQGRAGVEFNLRLSEQIDEEGHWREYCVKEVDNVVNHERHLVGGEGGGG